MKIISILIGSTLALCVAPLTVYSQSVFTECQNPGQVAITFDDGPHPTLTPQILDLFKSYNLTTTFFIIGLGSWESNTTRYWQAISRAYAEGHQIGSHTWSHEDLTAKTIPQIRAELLQISALVNDVIGKNLTVMRPPFGSYNDQVLQVAQNEFGYAVVNWNVDTNDWSHPDDSDAGLQQYISRVEGDGLTSGIGLHHDWTSESVQLANKTIQYLQQKNFRIVTVAECIGVPMYRDRF